MQSSTPRSNSKPLSLVAHSPFPTAKQERTNVIPCFIPFLWHSIQRRHTITPKLNQSRLHRYHRPVHTLYPVSNSVLRNTKTMRRSPNRRLTSENTPPGTEPQVVKSTPVEQDKYTTPSEQVESTPVGDGYPLLQRQQIPGLIHNTFNLQDIPKSPPRSALPQGTFTPSSINYLSSLSARSAPLFHHKRPPLAPLQRTLSSSTFNLLEAESPNPAFVAPISTFRPTLSSKDLEKLAKAQISNKRRVKKAGRELGWRPSSRSALWPKRLNKDEGAVEQTSHGKTRKRAPTVAAPLPVCAQIEHDEELEKLYRECLDYVTSLTKPNVSTTIIQIVANVATGTTTLFLQKSISGAKPGYTKAAVRILRQLYDNNEWAAKQLCSGMVPFLEITVADHPLEMVLSQNLLPSAMACIYYLLITRYAQCWPSPEQHASEHTTSSPSSSIVMLKMAEGIGTMAWISQVEDPLTKEEAEEFESDIFTLTERTLEDQLKLGMTDKAEQLTYWKVIDNILKLHRSRSRTLGRALSVLEALVKISRCLEVMAGWSLLQNAWTKDFSRLEILAVLGNAGNNTKHRALDILRKAVFLNPYQADLMAEDDVLMKAAGGPWEPDVNITHHERRYHRKT
ncbi:MAG: hypothetical protein BYD32DRAFT_421519 [Podila humilis]|nr:MAG: hypothetical protein BYD32DRAFT_421519 [Podila humilis]